MGQELHSLLQLRSKLIYVYYYRVINSNVLENQRKVSMLNMSYNLVTDFKNTLRSLRKTRVRKLWLDYNPLRNPCDLHNVSKLNKIDETNLPALNELSLVGIGASKLCFAEWKSLQVLNLTKNIIEELQVRVAMELK